MPLDPDDPRHELARRLEAKGWKKLRQPLRTTHHYSGGYDLVIDWNKQGYESEFFLYVPDDQIPKVARHLIEEPGE